MHDLAVVLLVGLGVHALTEPVDHGLLRRYMQKLRATVRPIIVLGVGVLLAWAGDYSVFVNWQADLRSAWMGPVATGLMLGGIAMVWRELLAFVGSYARRSRDEAAEIESRIGIKRPRAA